MWRQNACFPVNSDSDQSISDEEDFRENCFSLNSNTEKKEGLLLQRRLELLRDDNQSSSFVEDEVEMPDFLNEGGLSLSQENAATPHPDELIVSDSEDDDAFPNHAEAVQNAKLPQDNRLSTFRSKNIDGELTWSMMSKEAEALIHLNDDAFSSALAFAKASKSSKGVRGKVKPKFSLHFKMNKNEQPQSSTSTNENVAPSKSCMPEQLGLVVDGTVKDSDLEFIEDFHGEGDEMLKTLPVKVESLGDGIIKHSMAELLDGLQDRSVIPGVNSRKPRRTRGKRTQFVVKDIISPLGEKIINSEEQPELVVSGSSYEDETTYQYLANPMIKKQTMVDQFQEALAATSFSNEGIHVISAKLSGVGLFGKLQQVMQSEKERDTEFLQRMQTGCSPNDESHSIFAKILSRYLEGKLIVCCCSFAKSVEGFQLPDSSSKAVDMATKGTVIFNPKLCSDVDLEVGSFISIRPPWKEVQVMSSEDRIILCTYFSHV